MAVTENQIRTVIEIIDKGALGASQRIEKIHAQLLKLSATETERGKGYTGMRGALDKYARQTEEVAKTHGELATKQTELKKAKKSLSDEEQRTYNETAIQMGKYQQDLKKTTLAKQQFSDEFKRLQARTKAYPQDIRNWTAQQSLLNRAQQQGTITAAKYKKNIEPVNKQLKELEGRTGRNIAKMIQWAVGWFVIYRAIRMVMGGITGTIKTYGDLENEMARVSTVTRTMGETKKDTMEMLYKAVLKYGATSIRSFREVAEAMYHLGSAGLNVVQQLAGLEAIMNLTIGTMGNVREVARLVAGSFNVYGKQLEWLGSESAKFRYIADLLAYTYHNQQVELSEIASAMTLVGSAGALLDIDYKVLIGTIGELNTGLLRGTRAGTSLMNAFVKIAQNSDDLGRVLGVTFDPDMPLDFVDVMTQLHNRFGDQALAIDNLRQLMQIFGLRGARAVAQLINRFDAWKKTVEVSDATFSNFAKHMEDTIQDTLPRQLKILGNLIYKNIVEKIKPGLDALKDFVKVFTEAGKHAEFARIYEKLGIDAKALKIIYEKYPETYKKLLEKIKDVTEEKKKQEGIEKEIWRFIPGTMIAVKEVYKTEESRRKEGEKILEQKKDELKWLRKLMVEEDRILSTEEKRKKAAEEASKKRAVEKGIKDINEERERTLRLMDLELTGHAEYLIQNEKIIKMYKDAMGARKATIPTQEMLNDLTDEELKLYKEALGVKEAGIPTQEMLNGLTDEQREMYEEALGMREAFVPVEEVLNGLSIEEIKNLRKIGWSWEEIQAVVVALATRDMPRWEKSIMELEDSIRDVMEAWIAGTQEWGNIAQNVIQTIGDYLEAELTQALQAKPGEGKGLLGFLAAGLPSFIAGPIGAIVGGLFAGLGALAAGAGKDQEKIREATLDVSAGIDISNEQLAIINRNLLALRMAWEGYPMAESYYLRQRPNMGVQVQGIYINMPEGSSGSDVVQAIEESFGLAGSRVYQPS